MFLRDVRLVPVRSAAPGEPVSLRIAEGTIVAVGTGLSPEPGDRVVEAGGRWAIPGLWDQHVHFTQWAQTRTRLDVSSAEDPSEAVKIIRRHLPSVPDGDWLFAFGFRLADWTREPTVAELDAVTGDRPVVVTSGDAHTGWLNSAALTALGAPLTDGPLTEAPWFALMADVVQRNAAQDGGQSVADAMAAAASRGVVGVVDFEWAEPLSTWRERLSQGLDALWVRSAVYPEYLDDMIAVGLRTGSSVTPDGPVTVGPLKIISDGSLNTRTAYCHEPYGGGSDRGVQNHDRADLIELLTRARSAGFRAAVHAIGDAAAHEALAAFRATGVGGSIEHAQLLTRHDIEQLAELGVRASVQPAHLLDDRDVTERLWADRADRCFPWRGLLDAGVDLVFGSDAPVAPLDPWIAMAAAVHRSADERSPWNPAEAITAAEALAASVDGADTLAVGQRADLVLLDRDPLEARGDSAAVAAHLRSVQVEATVRAGRFTHASASLEPWITSGASPTGESCPRP